MLISNKYNYIFDVQCHVELEQLDDCTIFETKEELYQHVFDSIEHGLASVQELSGCELIITKDKRLKCHHSLSDGEQVQNVETFINTYEE